MRYLRLLLLGATLSLIISSCVTQKKKDDLSGFGKFYHNQTARFNGYYNADVLYTEAIYTLNERHQDNYTQLLPIHPYAAVDDADAVAPDMDKAIEKVATVSKLHPGSEWTPDCYVMMGKAQYLKQDYESAQATLEYFEEEFNPNSPKNRASRKSAKRRASSGKTKSRNTSAKKKRPGKTKKRPEAEDKKDSSKSKKDKKTRSSSDTRSTASRKKKSSSKKKRRAKPGSKKRPTKTRERPVVDTPAEDKASEATEKIEEKSKPEYVVNENGRRIRLEEEKEEEEQSDFDLEEDSDRRVKDDGKKEFNQDKTGEGIFGHTNPYSEGELWLARTYIKRTKYSRAEYLLNKIEADPLSYKDVLVDVSVARAELAIARKNWDKAVQALDAALEEIKDKGQKARLAYIKGQILDRQGNRAGAAEAFAQVVKLKPDYQMSFNAELNRLRNSGGGQGAEALADLEKLLKDDKNREYRDQIYYAMARIHLDAGDRMAAIDNLNLAVENGGSNAPQLGESHYLLAQLNFEDEDYIAAKTNYDGAVNNLSKIDSRYPEVESMAKNLQEIVGHLQTIELQDSLLAISYMSDDEKKAFAKKLRKARKEEATGVALGEEEKEREDARASAARRASVGSLKSARESSFYAYDEKEIKRQQKAFLKVWGQRPLVDDWRRVSTREAGTDEEDFKETDDALLSETDLDRILQDVPVDDQARAASEDLIISSLMELGKLYRSRLSDYENSVEALEELTDRFPNSKNRLDAWFYLYLSHRDLGQNTQAQKYKQLIIDNYPESEYYKVLTNPDYASSKMREQLVLDQYYRETYAVFQSGNCDETFQRIEQSRQTYGTDHSLMARFDLLGAMCTGKADGTPAYIKSLQAFVKKYPDTDEEVRAREIIRLLGGRDDQGGGIASDLSKVKFTVSEDKLHFVIVVLYNTDLVSLDEAKIAINTYNKENHKLDNLRMSSIALDTKSDTPVILLRRFKDKATAMKYYDGVQRKSKRFLPSATDYEIFAVNQNNWREIIRNKNVTTYRTFFEENYLNN